jgi:hypothetical protein
MKSTKDMNESQELIPIRPQTMAVERPVDPQMTAVSVLSMARAVMEKGMTVENVTVMEKMIAMAERLTDKEAEKQYNAALAKLQSECKNVIATKDVNGKFRYAPFLDIWNSARPAVERNGFTLQWDQSHLGTSVKVTLTLRHSGGHKEDFGYTMRLGTDAPGMPEGSKTSVIDEVTESRAKRRLLMDVLNIVVDAVSAAEDVGNGKLADYREVDVLRNRWLAAGGTEEKALYYANCEKWNQVTQSALETLQKLAHDKERMNRKAKQ